MPRRKARFFVKVDEDSNFRRSRRPEGGKGRRMRPKGVARFPSMRIELRLFIACLLSIKYWPPIKAALYTKMIYSCKCGYYGLNIPPENMEPGIWGFPDTGGFPKTNRVLGNAHY
jgi:hypothetical protein